MRDASHCNSPCCSLGAEDSSPQAEYSTVSSLSSGMAYSSKPLRLPVPFLLTHANERPRDETSRAQDVIEAYLRQAVNAKD